MSNSGITAFPQAMSSWIFMLSNFDAWSSRIGLVASRLRIRKAFLRSRGPAWLGGTLLNSFALVLTTRPALAIPSGWSGVEGLGLSFW